MVIIAFLVRTFCAGPGGRPGRPAQADPRADPHLTESECSRQIPLLRRIQYRAGLLRGMDVAGRTQHAPFGQKILVSSQNVAAVPVP
jgi:hypothetical protein